MIHCLMLFLLLYGTVAFVNFAVTYRGCIHEGFGWLAFVRAEMVCVCLLQRA